MASILVAPVDPVIPIFATPRSLKRAMDTWLQMRDNLHMKREMWKLSRSLKGLARPLLSASTSDQMDQVIAQSLPEYMALKFGLAKLLMFELTREGRWSPERFLLEYDKACAEAVRIVREKAPTKLDIGGAEMLVSAVEGLVLFSANLLSAEIHGKVRNENTVLLCLEPFIKADFLLLASFLLLRGEVKHYDVTALRLIAEKADAYMTGIEDIILSRNSDFAEQERTVSLEEYIAREGM